MNAAAVSVRQHRDQFAAVAAAPFAFDLCVFFAFAAAFGFFVAVAFFFPGAWGPWFLAYRASEARRDTAVAINLSAASPTPISCRSACLRTCSSLSAEMRTIFLFS